MRALPSGRRFMRATSSAERSRTNGDRPRCRCRPPSGRAAPRPRRRCRMRSASSPSCAPAAAERAAFRGGRGRCCAGGDLGALGLRALVDRRDPERALPPGVRAARARDIASPAGGARRRAAQHHRAGEGEIVPWRSRSPQAATRTLSSRQRQAIAADPGFRVAAGTVQAVGRGRNSSDADGAPGRNRTSTVLPPPDFESGASTNSATGAYRDGSYRRRPAGQRPYHCRLSCDIWRQQDRDGSAQSRATPSSVRAQPPRQHAAVMSAGPMSDQIASMVRTRPLAAAATAIAVVGAAAILGAWFFQYALGLKPCPLCLEQRYAYYFAIPLAVMVVMGDQVGASRKVLIAALVAIAAGMLWNTYLGIYHSGVEWKWWQGPTDCSGRAGEPRHRRQSRQDAGDDERRALRRGGLALPRAVARRLQRADLADARRHRDLGRGDGAPLARAESPNFGIMRTSP